MFVIYGVYRDIKSPLFYTEDEHKAYRLTEALREDSAVFGLWQTILYDSVIAFRRDYPEWDDPFKITVALPSGNVIKPHYILFEEKETPTYETSSERERGILSDPPDNDRSDPYRRKMERRERAIENLRSVLRERRRAKDYRR